MSERSWKYLQLERSGRVLTVQFDSGSKVNSLGNALMRELTELAIALQDDTELSAIVLAGKPTIFSAGMDLKDPEAAQVSSMSMAEKRQLVKTGPAMCAAWEALEPVTIVAIEGWCIGGGMALAVACNLRVAGTDALLYVPEIKLGMNMSWQSVPRFVNLIGPAKTRQLLILAEPLPAATAERWGLVDYLAPAGSALAMAQTLATQIAAMPPLPVRLINRAITTSATALNHATSFTDADQFLLTQGTQDAREGVAAFVEKREPKFTGS